MTPQPPGSRQRAQLLELGWALGGIDSEDELTTAVMETTAELIDNDEAGFNEVDLDTGHARVDVYPRFTIPPQLQAQLLGAIAEHPALAAMDRNGCTWPLRLSDLVPFDRFAHTRAYAVMFEPRGLRHQLVVPLRVTAGGRTGMAYSLNRGDRDFTDAELWMAAALQPVLAAHHATRKARRPSDEHTHAAAAFRLTRRELEILSLISSGMTAVAIGHALRISPRTVRKHLENTYAKLGIHDRLHAVAHCRRLGIID